MTVLAERVDASSRRTATLLGLAGVTPFLALAGALWAASWHLARAAAPG